MEEKNCFIDVFWQLINNDYPAPRILHGPSQPRKQVSSKALQYCPALLSHERSYIEVLCPFNKEFDSSKQVLQLDSGLILNISEKAKIYTYPTFLHYNHPTNWPGRCLIEPQTSINSIQWKFKFTKEDKLKLQYQQPWFYIYIATKNPFRNIRLKPAAMES